MMPGCVGHRHIPLHTNQYKEGPLRQFRRFLTNGRILRLQNLGSSIEDGPVQPSSLVEDVDVRNANECDNRQSDSNSLPHLHDKPSTR